MPSMFTETHEIHVAPSASSPQPAACMSTMGRGQRTPPPANAARPHHAYVFANKRSTRLKVLVHDGIGIWLAARRLYQGRFVWPGMTVRDNLELGAVTRADKAEKRRTIDEVMSLFPTLARKSADRGRGANQHHLPNPRFMDIVMRGARASQQRGR